MIKLEVKKGVQTIKEVCDTCKVELEDLTVNDIAVNKTPGITLRDKNGNVLNNTAPRQARYCDECKDD